MLVSGGETRDIVVPIGTVIHSAIKVSLNVPMKDGRYGGPRIENF